MRIGLCLFKYFPYGGLQRDFMKIAKEALARKHEVIVYTMEWQGPIEPGLQVEIVAVKGFSNHARAWRFSKKIQQKKRAGACDVWLGFNRQWALDFYFAADPCLAVQLQLKKKRWLSIWPRYRRYLQLEQGVYGQNVATKILLLDPKQQALVQACYHTDASRFVPVSPGIARLEKRLSKADARAGLTDMPVIFDHKLCLLAVGFDQRRKGLDRTLLALAALPAALKLKVQLWVVGQVGIKDFASQASALGLDVHCLGSRDDVYELMQAADLLVHPAYQETAGMVLVEALVNGLPVVVTDNCGYAPHIAKAQAGRVIVGGEAFQQVDYNKALNEALAYLPQGVWQENALRYAQNTDLFQMPSQVLDCLERFNMTHSS